MCVLSSNGKMAPNSAVSHEFVSKLKEFRSIRSDPMTMYLPRCNKLTRGRDNKLSCERDVPFAPGQSLPKGSTLPRRHLNRPLALCLLNN